MITKTPTWMTTAIAATSSLGVPACGASGEWTAHADRGERLAVPKGTSIGRDGQTVATECAAGFLEGITVYLQ